MGAAPGPRPASSRPPYALARHAGRPGRGARAGRLPASSWWPPPRRSWPASTSTTSQPKSRPTSTLRGVHRPGAADRTGAVAVAALRGCSRSIVMVVALGLLFVPGINAVAFLGANAYLSGRQYFEFAALRHRSAEEAAGMLRHAHPGVRSTERDSSSRRCCRCRCSTCVTPLFGTALMVRGPPTASRTPDWRCYAVERSDGDLLAAIVLAGLAEVVEIGRARCVSIADGLDPQALATCASSVVRLQPRRHCRFRSSVSWVAASSAASSGTRRAAMNRLRSRSAVRAGGPPPNGTDSSSPVATRDACRRTPSVP